MVNYTSVFFFGKNCRRPRSSEAEGLRVERRGLCLRCLDGVAPRSRRHSTCKGPGAGPARLRAEAWDLIGGRWAEHGGFEAGLKERKG